MNGLDIVIAVVVGGCAAYGFVRGFVRIAVGIAGLALSLAFALRLADQGPRWFGEILASAQFTRIAAFVCVLVAGLLATGLVAFLAHRLVRTAQLSWLDRLLGGGIGFVGSTLVTCGVLVGLTAFMPPGAQLLQRSVILPYAIVVSDVAAAILPPEMAELYRERRGRLYFQDSPVEAEPVEQAASRPS